MFSFGVILWELITWRLPWEELGTFQASPLASQRYCICLLRP